MPADGAVRAAKEQSLRASEELDLALRQALFRDSRPLALRQEILDVAKGCERVDALADALDAGRARGPMLADSRRHRGAVQGSRTRSSPTAPARTTSTPGRGQGVPGAHPRRAGCADTVRRAAAR
jgi:hypothetical protein